ncbi:adenosylcobinamide-phosphate synthase CbiB [Methyloferula stellata]|uniref:adenosylcobinamide-phosphate synthase CbiB n=1 Tax=Methyloferula stellata TaxID=876270 RepID=UPI00035C7C8B|nr:adenosylcobinamide-phosphate synthase CbiB [Methyloferula stellata]
MFLSHESLWILVLALLLDAVIGDPDVLWAHVPHPAVLMGRLIAALDRRCNDPARSEARRKAAGVFVLTILVIAAIGIGFGLERLLDAIPFGSFIAAFLASVLFAQRSLYGHIKKVRSAFTDEGLESARSAVARVVGRDPQVLDEAAICRAAIESCAENFSDGVVAPAFWFALFGLPGLITYKIVNTADSMIGHKTPRHAAFGWASARFDDLLNLAPARLAGLLLSVVAPVVGGDIKHTLSIMWRDARLHRSPNAGWPESAAAGALGLALAGPRQYAGQVVDDPFLNPQGRMATPDDISRALHLLVAGCGLEILIYAALALLL